MLYWIWVLQELNSLALNNVSDALNSMQEPSNLICIVGLD